MAALTTVLSMVLMRFAFGDASVLCSYDPEEE